MRQLIAGNWKMNGIGKSLDTVRSIKSALAKNPSPADVLLCPPSTLIARAAEIAAGTIAIGGQDCHAEPSGAFTGDISAEMLRDAGASAVIVGHSERRLYHRETSAAVAAKARAAWRAGLLAIVCIGETEAERAAGSELDVCGTHLAESIPAEATASNAVIAYEPVWAIGTGRTPTAAEITAMHAHIRKCLVEGWGDGAAQIRIVYGGSVKPANAREILSLPDVGGALVGGASLKPEEFLAILAAAVAAKG